MMTSSNYYESLDNDLRGPPTSTPPPLLSPFPHVPHSLLSLPRPVLPPPLTALSSRHVSTLSTLFLINTLAPFKTVLLQIPTSPHSLFAIYNIYPHSLYSRQFHISNPNQFTHLSPPMASSIPNDSDHTQRTTSDSCSTKYKGVRKRKWGKWVSEIRLPNSRERIWLGSYDSPEKAARAFDAALYCLRGPQANFNFPDTPLELEITVSGDHRHQSRSAQEIQELAARFANEYQQEQPMVQRSSEAAAPSSCESDGVIESGDPVEVDNGVRDIRGINDWSFLKSLDEIGSANYSNCNYNGFYSGFDKMHSGELLFPTSPPHLLIDHHVSDNGGDAMECDDAFYQQSLFLWNF